MHTMTKNSFHHQLVSSLINYYIAGSLAGGKFRELTLFEYLAKERLVSNRLANGLLIASTNLDSFRLANRGRFTKFTILSHYTATNYLPEVNWPAFAEDLLDVHKCLHIY